MRVLQVNDYASGGGAEGLMQRTAGLLQGRGHEVRVFTGDHVGLKRTALGYIDNRSARRALRQVVHEFQPHVIHLHNFYHLLSPGVLAELMRLKKKGTQRGDAAGITDKDMRIVMTAHDYHLLCPNSGLCIFPRGRMHMADASRLNRLGYLLTQRWDHRGRGHSALKLFQHLYAYRIRRLHRVIDMVIAPSRYLRDMLAARGHSATWIPNPVPSSAGSGAFSASGRSSGSLHMVFAGRIEPEKGVPEFIAALPASFNGQFTVIGNGGDMTRARRVAKASPHRPRIAFAGSLPHKETLDHIAAAHVLVLPSRWVENSPLVLAEALACGTNILVADHPPLREILDDAGTGFAFTSGQAASLAAAMHQIARAHAAGTLNARDVSAFIAARREAAYVEQMEQAYRSDPREPRTSASRERDIMR